MRGVAPAACSKNALLGRLLAGLFLGGRVWGLRTCFALNCRHLALVRAPYPSVQRCTCALRRYQNLFSTWAILLSAGYLRPGRHAISSEALAATLETNPPAKDDGPSLSETITLPITLSAVDLELSLTTLQGFVRGPRMCTLADWLERRILMRR